jgi:hypothetical protein
MFNNPNYRREEPESKPELKFDLIEAQKLAKDCLDPKQLYYLWDGYCRQYERRTITEYELEEMKEVILVNLDKIYKIKKSIL